MAVRLTSQHDYDLILMDVEMPELDGFQATAQIRQREAEQRRYRVPIVAVTAHALPVFRQRCLDAGMDDYATKPIPRQRLLELVNRWLDRRKVILAADDSADGRALMRGLLRQAGNYRLVTASNGQEAVALFRQLEVALVLLDMSMPVLDGYAAAQAIRSMPHGKSVPIVAITGYEGAAEVQKCLAAGCTEHLPKPVRARELQLLVDRLLVKPEAQHDKAGRSSAALTPVDLPVQSEKSASFQPELAAPEARDLIPSFLAHCRSDIMALGRLLQEQQFARIAVIGHNMKGTGASFGFPALGRLAARLEQAAQKRDANALSLSISELEAHVAELPVFPDGA